MPGLTEEWEEKINENRSKHYVKILNFGKKMKTWANGREICSLPFLVSKSEFQLLIFPNGDDEDCKNCVSVFLLNINSWDVKVNFEIEIGSKKMDWINVRINADDSLGNEQFYTHGDLNLDRVLDRGSLTVSAEISLAFEEFANDVNCKLDKIKDSTAEMEVLKQEVGTLKEIMQTMDRSLTSQFKTLEISSKKSSLPCPECPICFEEMKPPTRIVQCWSGHLICQQCKVKPEIVSCPTCEQEFTGRAIGMETYLRALFC